jgi:HD-GYP domain-containing protein (c-di-GMP phosphodiesterase class II)
VHNISNIFTDLTGTLDIIMGISMNAMGASGGLFIKEDGGIPELLTVRGLSEEGQGLLWQDGTILGTFSRLVGDNQYCIFKKGDPDYLDMPSHLVAVGAEVVLLIGVPYEKGRCIAAFWGSADMELYAARDYQITAALIMAKRMVDILNNHIKFKEYSKSYVKMLKFLANMVDNLSPYTIGYSELMSRYSSIIAREMNLTTEEIKDVSLAAYLSNIGVLGLSDNLFHKKGKYTDYEYEMMKLHTEVGASIIEATIANQRVADFIRYHHERMDGNGYMAGLKGEEIPVGARIIAVVQTFLAKIMGREYRSLLPFKEALNLLKSSSYTQLDARIVDVLTGWFNRKQRENMNNKCSLGSCWEMRCCPDSVSAGCPVYQNNRINCWDAPDNNCKAHGNSCSTCYIYTEYQNRMDQRI